MPEENLDHIADLQQRLYARDPESVPKRTYGILRPLKSKVDSVWGENDLPPKERPKVTTVSGYKRFFVVSFVLFLLALGGALFSVYRGASVLSSKNVEMTILGNSFVSGGEALPIQVDIANKNAADLVEAQITLSYPKGSNDAGEANMERTKIALGTIPSGKTKTQGFQVILYGEQGTSRTLNASLEYKLSGSNTTFVKESTFSVMINSSPVALTVDAPSSIVSNQPFTINIRTVFTGDTLLDNAIVHVDYPAGYVFDSATPTTTVGSDTWALGDLVKGTERIISIKGRLIGEEQDEKAFHIYVGSRTSETDARIAVSYNSALHSIIIQEPFISGSIGIDGGASDIITLPNGSYVSGTIRFINNSAIRVASPVFILALSGNSIDISSIKADGAYYDEVGKTLTWTTDSSLRLGTLEPGASGELLFGFGTKQTPGAGDITLLLSVAGTFPDRDFLEDSITNIDQKTIRFASRLQFAAQALYSIGPIKNTGPFPPKVGQETTYTISWVMKPTENALSGANASATLPIGVVWAGVVSPQSETLSYNPETRVVSWSIGGVPKAFGTSGTRQVAFQVKVKPQKNQTYSVLELLGETTVSATDAVANAPISTTRPPLTSILSSDPAYSVGKEKVLP